MAIPTAPAPQTKRYNVVCKCQAVEHWLKSSLVGPFLGAVFLDTVFGLGFPLRDFVCS